MLYMPPAFRIEDLPQLHSHMERHPFATLITVGADRPLVSHLPLLLDRSEGQHGVLWGHLAKANPQISLTLRHALATAIFHGPDAYVSPNWYASKQEHGKVVPTWNYAVVHARGAIRFFEDEAGLRRIVDRLTDKHEKTQARPWSTQDAPERYIQAQLKGIVGFQIEITELDGKYKLSQNRPEADRKGVVAGLASSSTSGDSETADLMKQTPG